MMGIFLWFADTKIGRFIGMIGGIILAALTIYFSGRRAGSISATKDLQQKDLRNAEHIHQVAAAARASNSADVQPVDDKLRKLGRLRD